MSVILMLGSFSEHICEGIPNKFSEGRIYGDIPDHTARNVNKYEKIMSNF